MSLYTILNCKALLTEGGRSSTTLRQFQYHLQTTEYCRLNVEPLVNICSLTRFWKPMCYMWKHSLQKSRTDAA